MRVVIGEDEALLRRGLVLVLQHAGFEVAGVTGDADELVRAVDLHAPDLVVTDIRMPPKHTDDGLVAALRIREKHPATAVLVLSQHVQRRYALELLHDKGAGVGYLLKQRIADVDTFCQDARRVCAGGTVLDSEVVATMLTRTQRSDALDRLTARQREVLGLMAEGRSNTSIAQRLSISDKAVVQHVSHIYEHLGLPVSDQEHRRVLAVVRYLSG